MTSIATAYQALCSVEKPDGQPAAETAAQIIAKV